MLLEINKQLLRNDLRSKFRLERLKSNLKIKKIDFIDWIYDVINGENDQENQEVEEISELERKEKRIFLKENFDNLVKKRQLIELLFYVWVENTEKIDSQSEKNKNCKTSNIQIEFALEAKTFLIDIITYNPARLINDFYNIIESNSELGQIHLRSSYYTCLHQLITEIDQQTDNPEKEREESTRKCWKFFIDRLTFWWSLSKDYLITIKNCYLRYNLLAYFIENSKQEQLMSFQNGVLISRISSGIHKRLTEPKYSPQAIFIWSKLAKLLDLDSEIEIDQEKSTYFEIEEPELKSEQIYHQSTLSEEKETQIKSEEEFDLVDEKENQEEKENLESSDESENEDEFVEFQIKAPQTLQDCIFALQNPLRREIGLKKLKKLIENHSEDLIFVWKNLLKCLLHPLTEQSGEILKGILVKRPKEWIEDVGEMFFKKDSTMNEKIILIECIETGINELSENSTQKLEENEEKNDFYFKRVTSKYFTEKPIVELKPEPQSRRWGHTRIAHEENLKKKNQNITSLLVVGENDPYLSRLSPIITQLFFKIIIKFAPDSKKSCFNNLVLTQQVLNILGTVAHNIKNYFEKYMILEEILVIVDRILSYVQSEIEKQKTEMEKKSSELQWDSKSISSIVMPCIQVLNKVVLSIDKYLPDMMLINLKDCVQKLKKIDIYGMRPLVEMVEANIFSKIS